MVAPMVVAGVVGRDLRSQSEGDRRGNGLLGFMRRGRAVSKRDERKNGADEQHGPSFGVSPARSLAH